MIPYPFLYIDEKLLKRDIKAAVKVYNKIIKLDTQIDDEQNNITACEIAAGDYCTKDCIKSRKRQTKLGFKIDYLLDDKHNIIEKWLKRPDIIVKRLDSIELITIANKSYPVNYIDIAKEFGIFHDIYS